MRSVPFLLALTGIVWLSGCSESGPTRYRVSGEARFNGAPIPFGDVLFTPDGAKQNSGPQGIANIRDGKFDTSGTDGKGIAGGPTVVRVTGLSGPPDKGGKLICEYEYTVELPRGDSTLIIEVPASAAPKKAGATPEI
jgi:hypothetical protein